MMTRAILITFLSLFVFTSNAQELGFHFGLNYANILDKDDTRNVTEFLDFSNAIGLNIGVDLQLKALDHLFLKTGLAYSQKGYTSDRLQQGPLGSAARDVNLNYLELPLHLLYSSNQKIAPYISGGVYVAYLLGGKYEFVDSDFESALEAEIKNLDLGASASAGMRINSIALEIGYNFGLLNVSNNTSENSVRKTRSLSVLLVCWL